MAKKQPKKPVNNGKHTPETPKKNKVSVQVKQVAIEHDIPENALAEFANHFRFLTRIRG